VITSLGTSKTFVEMRSRSPKAMVWRSTIKSQRWKTGRLKIHHTRTVFSRVYSYVVCALLNSRFEKKTVHKHSTRTDVLLRLSNTRGIVNKPSGPYTVEISQAIGNNQTPVKQFVYHRPLKSYNIGPTHASAAVMFTTDNHLNIIMCPPSQWL